MRLTLDRQIDRAFRPRFSQIGICLKALHPICYHLIRGNCAILQKHFIDSKSNIVLTRKEFNKTVECYYLCSCISPVVYRKNRVKIKWIIDTGRAFVCQRLVDIGHGITISVTQNRSTQSLHCCTVSMSRIYFSKPCLVYDSKLILFGFQTVIFLAPSMLR